MAGDQPEAVKNAIRLGAHSVEHGYILDDECIELFLKHDTWYVPTLAISHLTPDQANNDWEQRWVRQRNMAHALCCRADAASDVHRDGFAKALKAGVKMALGRTSGRSRMPRCSNWDCGSAMAPRRGRRSSRRPEMARRSAAWATSLARSRSASSLI